MTEVLSYKASVTDEEGMITYYTLISSTTAISTVDGSDRLMVDVGRSYVVAVQSVNSVGASETSVTLFGELKSFF